ncbi:MAG: hypothetical protein IJ087_00030 [Eggerthellaceae bacterium]|nr:hypothetical protein [Eggerthellaceae bacterium]
MNEKPVAFEDILYSNMEQWIREWKESQDAGKQDRQADKIAANPEAPSVHDGKRRTCAA